MRDDRSGESGRRRSSVASEAIRPTESHLMHRVRQTRRRWGGAQSMRIVCPKVRPSLSSPAAETGAGKAGSLSCACMSVPPASSRAMRVPQWLPFPSLLQKCPPGLHTHMAPTSVPLRSTGRRGGKGHGSGCLPENNQTSTGATHWHSRGAEPEGKKKNGRDFSTYCKEIVQKGNSSSCALPCCRRTSKRPRNKEQLNIAHGSPFPHVDLQT
jgi:hypothetical protein